MPESVPINRNMPLTDAVCLILQEQLAEIGRQLFKARSQDLAESVEAVHDLRVALRRSLTLLQHASPWLDAGWLTGRDRFYRRLLRSLGRIRDIDVLAQNAADLCHSDDQPENRALLLQLQAEQQLRHGRLTRDLADQDLQKKYGRQVRDLTRFGAALLMTPLTAGKKGVMRLYRLGDCLPVMLYQAVAGLTAFRSIIQETAPTGDGGIAGGETASTASGIDSSETAPTGDGGIEPVAEPVLHRLRIAAKNFRYLLEPALPMLGEPGKALIKEFRAFQDVLGHWHDAVVACQWLAGLEKEKALGKDAAAQKAVAIWRAQQQNQMDSLYRDFFELWQAMTPAWFHQRLSAGLTVCYGQQETN